MSAGFKAPAPVAVMSLYTYNSEHKFSLVGTRQRQLYLWSEIKRSSTIVAAQLQMLSKDVKFKHPLVRVTFELNVRARKLWFARAV